jgi:Fur family transcriptional regulator, zinc uptake regulator
MSNKKALVKQVAEYCETNGIRFTEPRQYVLEIIADAKKPIGAYEMLNQLGQKLDNPKPPTAYRAIEFLSEHGFIHRIESLNAYISCHTDHRHQGSQFMICDDCGTVVETHLCHLPEPLAGKTVEAGFRLTRWNVELHGSCGKCSKV